VNIELIGFRQECVWPGNHNGQTKQKRDDILDDTDDIRRDGGLHSRHIIGQAAQEFTSPIVL
jgi:hypothetical protein